MPKKIFWLLIGLIMFTPLAAGAYSNPGKPAGFVNDYAGLMSAAARQSLETELSNFEKETRHEIAVVTIPNLGGDTIENFAVKLFEDWQIGKKGADNGVLFLISKDDRQMRVEVGYGLEGALTDAQSFAIIDKIAKPAFRAGDYDAGITQSVAAISAAARGEDVSGRFKESGKKTRGLPVGDWIYFVVFIIFILQAVVVRLSHTKTWWLGGIIGGILGLVLGLILFGLALKIILSAVFLAIIGLAVDYAASRNGPIKGGGSSAGGFFLGGGGGFGGFGGGRSGGGGSSGNW